VNVKKAKIFIVAKIAILIRAKYERMCTKGLKGTHTNYVRHATTFRMALNHLRREQEAKDMIEGFLEPFV